MTYEDAFLLSIGINVGLIYVNHRTTQKYHELAMLFAKLMAVIKGVANDELFVKQDKEGNVHIKEKVNG